MKFTVGICCFMCSIFGFANESYLEPLISESAIEEKIAEVGKVINQEYEGKQVVVVALLKGAICLAADLIREIEVPCSLEFIRCSSYGHGTTSGELTITGFEKLNLEGKDVLVIDDIFDTGKTMATVVQKIREKNPASVKSLVLLAKSSRRAVSYQPDYVLFNIGDYFVVGYGLDYNEYFRGLKGIYNLVLDELPEHSYAQAD